MQGRKERCQQAGKGRWVENTAPKEDTPHPPPFHILLHFLQVLPPTLGGPSPGKTGLGSSFDFSEPQFLISKIQIASDWLLGEPCWDEPLAGWISFSHPDQERRRCLPIFRVNWERWQCGSCSPWRAWSVGPREKSSAGEETRHHKASQARRRGRGGASATHHRGSRARSAEPSPSLSLTLHLSNADPHLPQWVTTMPNCDRPSKAQP